MKTTQQNSSQHSGLECPNQACKFPIKFTMIDLVTKQNITCPSCQLSLEMEVPVEMKKHLQEISLAEQMVRESSQFSR